MRICLFLLDKTLSQCRCSGDTPDEIPGVQQSKFIKNVTTQRKNSKEAKKDLTGFF